MSSFFQDLRFGLRQLAAKPGFAVAAILTLALGIGANTAVFSLLSGYLLKPLPYPHGGLAKISVEMPKLMPGDMPVSMPMYQVIREHSNAFTAVAMYWGDQYNLQVGGRAQEVLAYAVSASLFRVLGVQPLLGRTFTDANMHQGHNHVAVISYGLWRGSFGADPGVIGKTVRFNGEPYDIIGVMPKGFAFPDREAALWAPVTIAPDDFAPQHFFSLDGSLIGWLKPSVNVNGARERVRQAIGTWLTAHIPYKTADGDLINKALLQKYGFAMQVQPYRQDLLGDRPATLWLLQGAVLLILLITCVNVANLLLSRVLGRSHEMAMRSALGASRVTLGRQLLGEALCLTVPAGLGGVALAWLALHFLAGSALGAGNSIFNMTLDWRVGLFALAAVLFTALLVSVLPIRQLAKTDLQLVLQEGSRTSGGGRGARRTRNVLVIAELTLATGLLAMSGLLLHSFMNIEAVNPGFRTDHVLIAHLTVSPNDFSGTEAWSNTFKDVVKQVDTLPGVRQATISDMLPLTGYDYHMSFAIPGQVKPGERPPAGMVDRITGGFFKTLGIPVLQGRDFNDSDTGQARALIDAAVAARYFHDANPIGRRIRWRDIDWTIVGVVPPVKYSDLSQAAPPFTVYLNVDKSPSSDMYLLVHTALPPSALFKPLQHLLATAFPKVAVNDIHTMHEQMSDLLSHRQTTMALLLGFGGIALALAIVGVYAVMSYAVSQRRAECGVRLALGAQPEDLRWLVLRDGLRLLAVGLVLGLGLAVLFGYLMSAQLFGVAPFDPATLIGSTLVLCVITVAACYLPARRASKLDPAVAMMEQ